MSQTAADVMVDILIDWGVEVIFGIPGDGINGVMESLRVRKDKIRFVHVRHEESAAFMACAYAKYTGRLGVCLATSGPGGIHLLNGLYDAKMDGQPVLAITGHHYHDLIDTHQQQDVDLDRVFSDVAVYSTRVMGAAHVESVTELACRTALSLGGVAHINFPTDLQDQPVKKDKPSKDNVPGHVSNTQTRWATLPAATDLQHAADVLNAGQKVAILAGRGALGAGQELEQLAELLAAPVAKALLGKAAIADDSPYTTGGIGLLGTAPTSAAMQECDTLLIIGSSFPYIQFMPKPGQARGVQIDLDPTRIGLRYPVEIGLVGDTRLTLQALLPMLQRKTERTFLEKSQARMRDWRSQMDELAQRDSRPLKPQRLAHELGMRLSDTAIVSADSGSNTVWFARHIPARPGQMFSVSGMLASMACGLNYAIAAQIAYPDRQCVAFVGDGGFAMLMAEFATAVQYQLPIKVVVLKNNVLAQIKWEQMVFQGNPEYGVDLSPIDFAAFARACGGTGFTIDDPATCGAVLDEALATPGPVLVQAEVDPLEPPMPPHITMEQMLKFGEALARGEPKRAKIAATATEEALRELI